jgi:galactokinase
MLDPAHIRKLHRSRFNAQPADVKAAQMEDLLFVAPGRVNIIGEHTDYAEGFVLPAAIEFATYAAITPRADGKIHIYSENYMEERVFDAAAIPGKGSRRWSDYPLGVVAIFADGGHAIPGFSMTLASDVPLGSGLSSSAAVEMATALAVSALVGVDYPRPKLARLCQRAENEFVGANCGIMDQFISANAKADHALLLDCRDLSFRLTPIPTGVALVIANTMVRHSVAGGEYTSRRAEVEEACAVIARHREGVRFLRDATLDDLAKWGNEMSPNALKRGRHVISENLRTVAAADALTDGNLNELGRLMAEAHTSYSKDFEASCVEADTMVALANKIPGLIGARLTGGGFGGCTINLVEEAHAEHFAARLSEDYKHATGITPQIHRTKAAAGAHKVL